MHGRHWGVQGAAGLLPFAVTAGGVQVLLALRSYGTHQGGTWGTIGGAIEPGETPWEAAVREASEEAAWWSPPKSRRRKATATAVSADGPTSPSPSAATDRARRDPVGLGARVLRWISVDEVDAYPLHPALAESWPRSANW